MKKFRLETIHLVMIGLIISGILAISYFVLSSGLAYLLLVFLSAGLMVGLLIYQKTSYELTEQEQIELLHDTTESNLASLLENMPVGVIQFKRDPYKVSWFNPYAALLLTQENGDFNDGLILEFLAEKEGGAAKNVLKIGDKKFTVSLDSKHQMLYFWDIYSPARELSGMSDFSPVIAIVSVDNYDDLADSLSDAELSQINSFVAGFISDFANSKNIFYRRADMDRFYLFTDYFVLSELINDKFSMLERFREQAKARDLSLTLSMGISYGSHDHQGIGKAAQANLNMAMVRGGDQIVLKENDPQKDFQYFGGGTTSTVKRSRTRTRAMMTAISDKLKMAEQVFVVGHKNTDMDALGASLGMQFFASQLVKEAYAVYDPTSMVADVGRAVEAIKAAGQTQLVTLSEAKQLLQPNALLVMVDHSKISLTLSEDFYQNFSDVIIVDHHRRDDDFPKNASLSFIESGASSASELVTELIQFQNAATRISPALASLLMAGIMLDTKNFSTRVTSRTFDVASYLRRRGSDADAIQEISAQNFEEYQAVNSLVLRGQALVDGVMIAVAPEETWYNNVIVSQAADTLLKMSGVEASFVLARNAKGQILISARSKQAINVQTIMEQMGGGGHFNLAACQLEAHYSLEEAYQNLVELILETVKKD